MKKLLNLLICGIVPSLILVACDSGGENTTNSNSSPTTNQISQQTTTSQSKSLMINAVKTGALTNGYLFIGAENFEQPSLGAWFGNVFQCTVTNGTIGSCSTLDPYWSNINFSYVYRMNIANNKLYIPDYQSEIVYDCNIESNMDVHRCQSGIPESATNFANLLLSFATSTNLDSNNNVYFTNLYTVGNSSQNNSAGNLVKCTNLNPVTASGSIPCQQLFLTDNPQQTTASRIGGSVMLHDTLYLANDNNSSISSYDTTTQQYTSQFINVSQQIANGNVIYFWDLISDGTNLYGIYSAKPTTLRWVYQNFSPTGFSCSLTTKQCQSWNLGIGNIGGIRVYNNKLFATTNSGATSTTNGSLYQFDLDNNGLPLIDSKQLLLQTNKTTIQLTDFQFYPTN
jgi:hypothetical protein